MLFLVTGDHIDPGYLLPPDQTIQALEQAVVPSFQILAQWELQGKIKGGLFAGERAGVFVLEADSFEELDSMMNHLPFYGLVKWQVKPLISWQTMSQQFPQYLADARQQMQQSGARAG